MNTESSPSIKCGRRVFVLKQGDWVMDNGACYQLASREVMCGSWNFCSPRVSKSEFNRFVKIPGVVMISRKTYTAYVYMPGNLKPGEKK